MLLETSTLTFDIDIEKFAFYKNRKMFFFLYKSNKNGLSLETFLSLSFLVTGDPIRIKIRQKEDFVRTGSNDFLKKINKIQAPSFPFKNNKFAVDIVRF